MCGKEGKDKGAFVLAHRVHSQGAHREGARIGALGWAGGKAAHWKALWSFPFAVKVRKEK